MGNAKAGAGGRSVSRGTPGLKGIKNKYCFYIGWALFRQNLKILYIPSFPHVGTL